MTVSPDESKRQWPGASNVPHLDSTFVIAGLDPAIQPSSNNMLEEIVRQRGRWIRGVKPAYDG